MMANNHHFIYKRKDAFRKEFQTPNLEKETLKKNFTKL